jgi:hypothetical protein
MPARIDRRNKKRKEIFIQTTNPQEKEKKTEERKFVRVCMYLGACLSVCVFYSLIFRRKEKQKERRKEREEKGKGKGKQKKERRRPAESSTPTDNKEKKQPERKKDQKEEQETEGNACWGCVLSACCFQLFSFYLYLLVGPLCFCSHLSLNFHFTFFPFNW